SLLNQEIIASILKLSLQSLPLDEILRQSLVLVLQRHGFNLTLQGCVFLADDDTGELVMKVRYGLPESIVDNCGRLPFGRCLCGMAAESGKVIHADRIDERHEHAYTGMEPHGHYCVPIKDESGVLGVLNLYVPEGHQRSCDEEQFVLVIAHTMAGVVRRRWAEEALRKSEASLAEAQRIAHLGSWDWDVVRNDLSWSDETYRIFGISPEQFDATYESFLSYVHQTDRVMVKKAVDAALSQQQSYNIEHRIIRPDGVERSVHERGQVILGADRSPLQMIGTVQDVTEQQRAKESLRRLKEKLEKKERKRLAALLHDGVGQNLQAINLGLKMVAEDIAKSAATEILPELVEEVRKTIEEVRDLTEELSPVRLEQMDLAEAIRSHASKLAVRVKADFFINFDRETYAFLGSHVKEHCFLMFQEALTNAIKHSGAEKIMVQLDVEDDHWLLMQISDDGCGFSLEQTIAQDKGLGLSIIKERAMRLGGATEISSEPGKGTTVTVKVPVL
ncbi:MAG: PAS domain-containing protein, partial [Pseudomonadota bacterium]